MSLLDLEGNTDTGVHTYNLAQTQLDKPSTTESVNYHCISSTRRRARFFCLRSSRSQNFRTTKAWYFDLRKTSRRKRGIAYFGLTYMHTYINWSNPNSCENRHMDFFLLHQRKHKHQGTQVHDLIIHLLHNWCALVLLNKIILEIQKIVHFQHRLLTSIMKHYEPTREKVTFIHTEITHAELE